MRAAAAAAGFVRVGGGRNLQFFLLCFFAAAAAAAAGLAGSTLTRSGVVRHFTRTAPSETLRGRQEAACKKETAQSFRLSTRPLRLPTESPCGAAARRGPRRKCETETNIETNTTQHRETEVETETSAPLHLHDEAARRFRGSASLLARGLRAPLASSAAATLRPQSFRNFTRSTKLTRLLFRPSHSHDGRPLGARFVPDRFDLPLS